ncbi:unnamed protein product [Blepharisma stoltei]|uniref:Uncharacterized protein n=1 Tax=Blepharisma stoltei TaxID=1481888 RepID=A0AAU9JE17_9CILI|nr:unnamed protein product [Blepharisma stoltei]
MIFNKVSHFCFPLRLQTIFHAELTHAFKITSFFFNCRLSTISTQEWVKFRFHLFCLFFHVIRISNLFHTQIPIIFRYLEHSIINLTIVCSHLQISQFQIYINFILLC